MERETTGWMGRCWSLKYVVGAAGRQRADQQLRKQGARLGILDLGFHSG